MKEALDKMLERLETQYVAKQGKLGEARQKLKGRAMQLTRTTRDLENKVRWRARNRTSRMGRRVPVMLICGAVACRSRVGPSRVS